MAGSIILIRNRREKLNQIFSFLCLGVAYIEFGLLEALESNTEAEAAFWFSFVLFWPLIGPLFLHFAIIFTRQRFILSKKFGFTALYVPALALSIATFWLPLSGRPVHKEWGWIIGPRPTLLLVISLVIISCYGAVALFYCIRYYLVSRGQKRAQAGYVLAGLSLPVLTTLFTEDFCAPSSESNFHT